MSPWAALPADLVRRIAHELCASPGGDCPAHATSQLRLVCWGWAASLRIGECVPAKVWDWTERMDLALAPHACNLELLAPLPLAASSTLPELQHCSRLRSLRLQHVHLPALAALAGLTSLLLLDATVFFPDSTPDWLEWAAGLVKLQELRITAAQMRLQPEGGLSSLLPLRRHIQTLRLDDCMVLTDAGAAVMARLCALERLEVTCCRISQAALDQLARALPRLTHLETRLPDGVAVDALLRETRVAAEGGSLVAHVSQGKASTLVSWAGLCMPNVARLEVRLLGPGFLLPEPATFARLHHLECLSLPGILLPSDAVEQLGNCLQLQELEVELNFSVRDHSLLCWRNLNRMRRLRLTGNLSLGDEAVAGVLRGMPLLQELCLEQLHGSGAILAPLAAMSALRSLSLAGCHLLGTEALTASLSSATSLVSLQIKSCGVQSMLCEAVVAALSCLPALKEVQLGLRRALPAPAAEALASTCSGLTQLTALDLYFADIARDVPAVQAWGQLSSLTGLRRLHACTGLGWDAASFTGVAAAATALRALTVTDNLGKVVDGSWVAALAPLAQLSTLLLNSCAGLGAADADGAAGLCCLTALTSLEAFRTPGLCNLATVRHLQSNLPCLARISTHE
ncbi:hypothetical protein D9Q98_005631 [Chlorella vulgaris]|uniref:Uncharacterized protein n=1 Tax=Chlorella vulgaris TaxID=3077 RepID=A0A9D4TMA8_CHLVU|nr:hypothetical protein D9Q98_005631 [Chlorella vulgaris]